MLLTDIDTLRTSKDNGGTIVTFKGAEAWKTLAETLNKADLRTLRQTLTEHIVLIITLLTRSKSRLFTTRQEVLRTY